MRRESYNGSEIHRLKPMKSYDNKVFMKMYNLCKPVIKNLVYRIDYRRFNLTQDIIESYFWDKMLYVFNKYYDSSTEEHLKARILASLSTYKNKLLRYAYSDKASYNQKISKLEDLLDKDKESLDDSEDNEALSEMWNMFTDYMYKNLSEDAKLIFECLVSPPPYIKERIKEGSRITNMILLEFFDMPRTKSSLKYISEIREDIDYWLDRAKKDLHY